LVLSDQRKTVVGTALDPRENNNFTEGNAWQYTFVPQDIPGTMLMGER
jgi:putative alpha-1,2-mannosidase